MGAVLCGFGFWIVTSAKRDASIKHPPLPAVATKIFDRYSAATIIVDRSLTPVYTNSAARDDSHRCQDFFADPESLQALRQVLQTGTFYTKKPDFESGETAQVRVFNIAPGYAAVIIEDLGQEHRLNQVRQDFITAVSHELKTPVSAISLLSEAIASAQHDTAAVAKFSASLNQQAARLETLIKDIINLSRAQELPKTLDQIDIQALVKAEVKAHREHALQRDITLKFKKLKDSTPALVRGSQQALGLAISNVLTNAINYSDAGAKVGVGLRLRGDTAELTISDNGPGIEPALHERIFERFFRADRARGNYQGGTGLGLSIARHTMRAHDGDITVWSKPGMGSTFTLTFPLVDNAFSELAADSKKLKKREKKLKKQLREHSREHAQRNIELTQQHLATAGTQEFSYSAADAEGGTDA